MDTPVSSGSSSAGHNSDGKFIARAQRIEYDCELVPRRVAIFIEKTKDGQILPVPNVVVRDVACGANHTVRQEVGGGASPADAGSAHSLGETCSVHLCINTCSVHSLVKIRSMYLSINTFSVH